ncbi:hypothetical protein OS175_03400 [Marinicella sp. S1101]|uniref:hypothetical protein n=1 Tax=Marinicella marina TaxID=2996016 RepID=UPI002261040C|nr:hypothetical protein [Marinicella marina]MCX7552915.1 hypothetical protein [Marinicella marina]MDJ1139776.1 hypothetical protein [Marinicella marina]
MDIKKQQEKIDQEVTRPSLGDRIFAAFGPLTAGILIDALDVLTFGPIGMYVGPLFGALLGWWLACKLNFGVMGQCVLLAVTAIYCALPGSELMPLATAVMALARFFKPS